MKCPSCGFKNPAGSKFCGKCGAYVQITCRSCGQSVDIDMKFCNNCGQSISLQDKEVGQESREEGIEKTRLMTIEDEPGEEAGIKPPRINPYLVKEDGSKVEIVKNKIIIGREGKCDLVMTSLQVSARHASIKKTADGYLLTDLGSTNGTSVNNKSISNIILQNGDRIKIGPNILTFNEKAEEPELMIPKPMKEEEMEMPATIIREMPEIEGIAERPIPGPTEPEPGQEVSAAEVEEEKPVQEEKPAGEMEKELQEEPGEKEKQEFPFLKGRDGKVINIEKDKVIIGREKICDITLTSPGVSEKHASIEKKAKGYLLTDLGSTNGTFVNGKFISNKILLEGDNIIIGTENFSFHHSEKPAKPQIEQPEAEAARPEQAEPEPADLPKQEELEPEPVVSPREAAVVESTLTADQVQTLARKMEKGMPSPIFKSSPLSVVLFADEKLTWAGKCMSSWYFGPNQRRELYIGVTHLRFIIYYVAAIGRDACQSYWYDVDFGGTTWKSGFKTWRGFTIAPPEFKKKKIDLFPQKIRDDGKVKTLFVALPLEDLRVPLTKDGKAKFEKNPEGFFKTLQQYYDKRKAVNPVALLTLLDEPLKAPNIPGTLGK